MSENEQKQTKIIAMYLPQYHRTPENDEWWGEGYTDWEAVKKSTPLFDGHKQPKLPLNNNFYDLSKKSTMEWQASLMKQYGIDGICMYHYWFNGGRRVLDKPAENLLRWQDVDMPYCFCWANQTWARTWSNIKGANPWADNFEKRIDEENQNAVLLEQQYGLEEDWKKHFDYLARFFSDDRYIKVDNKPVIMLYRPMSIPCLLPMLDYWRKLAKEVGLDGLYIIGNLTEHPTKNHLDAGVTHEPMHSKMIACSENKEKQWKCSYDALWENILQYDSDEKMYRGAFVNFDDSPRRANKGFIADGYSVQKFHSYFERLLKKVNAKGDELLFINAWNEWGEGMYLEPDNYDGYKTLEAVKTAKEGIVSEDNTSKLQESGHLKGILPEKRFKVLYYKNIEAKWDELNKKKTFVGNLLLNHGILKIGIYGYGVLGKRLYEEINGSEINVVFFADQNPKVSECGIPCVTPEMIPEDVDAVVVTASFYFDEIYEQLSAHKSFRIISLKQLVEEAE